MYSYYGYSSGVDTMGIVAILAVLGTIAAMVLLYIFVLPAKKRDNLPKIGKIVHDIFTFKHLLLETVLRFLYVLCTVATIVFGVFMLFGFKYGQWLGGYGLLIAILGPIAIRLTYEGIMMFILLVKNTIQINSKLKDKDE